MDLIRWEPRRSLMKSFFEDFFDIMESPGRGRRNWSEGGMWEPAIDLIDKKDKLIAKVELPGVEKKDVKLSLTDNSLTIQGEIKKDEEIKKEDYYYRERAHGNYTRTISLPIEVDKDKISAKFTNGILEITLPKKPEVQPKEITIETD
ncbi:MAG: Hsp20/alpha crystallin family protein [Atribacterota bacterium]|nr:Hsp20/alpha crystallin family protein [Atribacterota bacterium]MDD5637134.1 Hsp20/alpha crystallin family protein [Atribacterota bacterium]